MLESNLKAVDVIIPEDALNDIDNILGFVRFERRIGRQIRGCDLHGNYKVWIKVF